MPPFQPNATVPGAGADRAFRRPCPRLAPAIAAVTWSRVTWQPRMSFRAPSFVSPTSALTERTFSLPGCAIVQRTTASTAVPTASVLVSTIGDSIVPSSCTCVEPASLPKALPTKTAPATLSRNRLPPCGRIAVTPVRTRSPLTTVVWPTRTPATSVIALQRSGTARARARCRDRARAGRLCATSAAASAQIDERNANAIATFKFTNLRATERPSDRTTERRTS